MTMTDIDAARSKKLLIKKLLWQDARERRHLSSRPEKQMKRSKELERFQKQVATLSKTYRSIRASRSKRRKLQRGTSTPQEEYYGRF